MKRSLLVGAALVVVLGGSTTWRMRRAFADVAEAIDAESRFVDMGVRLSVVRADPKGEELIPGKPRLRVLREHLAGGMVDTTHRPRKFCGPSKNAARWFCSERAEELVLHSDALPLRILVDGAMGAGKSGVLAMWLGLRAIEFTGSDVEGGVTAPTHERTVMIARWIRDLWPRAWWRWRERNSTFTLVNGVVIRLVSTHQNSEATGSRVQGYNWAFSGSDEIQDSLEVDGDIEARGRAAPHGRYKRLCTATVKDSPAWRNFKDRIRAAEHPVTKAPLWGSYRMELLASPFVDPDFVHQLKATLTEREYQRKVEALDVGPERRVYPGWSRAHNVRPVPELGAVDVTRQVLASYLPNAEVLVGHDPGKLWNVSLVLKAYQFKGQRDHVWFVTDELTTRETTSEEHGLQLRTLLRTKGLYQTDVYGRPLPGASVALIRVDPKPFNERATDGIDRTVMTTWRNIGLDVRPAAYSVARKGAIAGTHDPGQISKEAGIEMINRLVCNAAGVRRLFIACDDHRRPVAPRLVDAIERSERDEQGIAENQKKDVSDLSHWPASLRYALWELEKTRFEARAVGA